MNDRLDAGYRRYAELNDRSDRPIYIAPAGRAFAKVHADERAAGRDPLAADIVPIAVISLVLAFLATLYPRWRASRVNPAEALRYE